MLAKKTEVFTVKAGLLSQKPSAGPLEQGDQPWLANRHRRKGRAAEPIPIGPAWPAPTPTVATSITSVPATSVWSSGSASSSTSDACTAPPAAIASANAKGPCCGTPRSPRRPSSASSSAWGTGARSRPRRTSATWTPAPSHGSGSEAVAAPRTSTTSNGSDWPRPRKPLSSMNCTAESARLRPKKGGAAPREAPPSRPGSRLGSWGAGRRQSVPDRPPPRATNAAHGRAVGGVGSLVRRRARPAPPDVDRRPSAVSLGDPPGLRASVASAAPPRSRPEETPRAETASGVAGRRRAQGPRRQGQPVARPDPRPVRSAEGHPPTDRRVGIGPGDQHIARGTVQRHIARSPSPAGPPDAGGVAWGGPVAVGAVVVPGPLQLGLGRWCAEGTDAGDGDAIDRPH